MRWKLTQAATRAHCGIRPVVQLTQLDDSLGGTYGNRLILVAIPREVPALRPHTDEFGFTPEGFEYSSLMSTAKSSYVEGPQ